MAKERRLGRGLAALLGESRDTESVEFSEPEPLTTLYRWTSSRRAAKGFRRQIRRPVENELLMLGVHDIDDNPFQPRREFSEPEIVSLAESLKEHDMLQPILVRRVGERWQLISGERRLRAAIRAGWTQVPARVRTAMIDSLRELAIVENLQRKDLNPIEKALSFRRYLDEHDCTQEVLANRIKHRSVDDRQSAPVARATSNGPIRAGRREDHERARPRHPAPGRRRRSKSRSRSESRTRG